jgi:GntR family transcriptional regulator, transcriptional repressor for pyruvate dehydrogenase complex
MPLPEQEFARPIHTTRTFEAAIEHIIEGIERGRLRAGSSLPKESELAEQLGISRPTLRQGLRVLQDVGYLRVKPGKGGGISIVSDLVPTAEISRGIALEEEAIIETLHARRVLEGAITFAAMQAASEEDFDEIEHTISLTREHLGDRYAVMKTDAMFHRAVLRACRNHLLSESMRGLSRSMAPIRDSYRGGLDSDRQTLDIHARQLVAMRAGDAVTLTIVLHEHFCMLEEELAEALGHTWEDLFGRLAQPLHDLLDNRPETTDPPLTT